MLQPSKSFLEMDIVRTLAASVLFAVVLAQENLTERAGRSGHSVKLPCRIPFSQPPKVSWEDMAYTSSRDPILIFNSDNNPNFSINSNHPNSANYRVDKNNFDLKISKLTSDDVGTYSCISEVGPSVHRTDYYLLVYGSLECSGQTKLHEGEGTILRCNVTYAGKQPSLDWFRAEHLLPSVDRSGIYETLLAVKEHEIVATDDMDGKVFRCQMQLAEKEEECSLILNVTYPVRDIGFNSGDKGSFYVGEEVTCVARGNPAPEISLVPTSLPQIADDRKKSSIIIPRSWVGTEVTLECTAKNTYQGQEKVIQKSMAIRILEPTTTTTTKPTIKETPKPAGGGGEGLASWKGFPTIVLSVTLMKLIAFRC